MSLRSVLLGLLLAVALCPPLVRIAIGAAPGIFPADLHVTYGALTALGIAVMLNRQLSVFPGVSPIVYVIPCYTAAFAVVMGVFFFARLEYSRVDFLASYVLLLVWAFASRHVGRSVPKLAIVPEGSAPLLAGLDGAAWDRLSDPSLPPRHCDGIVADLDSPISAQWERFIAAAVLQGIPVHHSRLVREGLTGRMEIAHLSQNTLGSLDPHRLYFKLKHGMDWLVALFALVALLPLMLAVALAIRLETSGPVFFVQERRGFRGQTFRMIKFRTMRSAGLLGDMEAREHAMTLEDDPRITRVGRLLRRYRIDELPQIVNILRGEMSWIGPRPEAVALSHWYEAEIAFYPYRHILRPGITGWAQINLGHVASLDRVREKLAYDFYYIRSLGLWLDLVIVMRTVRIVLTGKGAR